VTTGLATTNLANKWLDMLGASAFTAPSAAWMELHTADPGAAGTTSTCTGTVGASRKQITWSAASAGSKAATTTLPSWTAWDGGSVTISHIAVWDASTSGTFLYSGALTTPRAITNGDTFNVTSHSVALTPLAA
jgi:hypothetical protein